MKKMWLALLTAAVLMLLTACDIPPEVFRDDDEVATEILQGLLISVQAGDLEAAQEAFSPVLRGDGLEKQLQLLAQWLPQGELVLLRDAGPMAARSTHDGESVWRLEKSCTYMIDGQVICVAIRICTYDSAEPGNVGISSVYVTRGEDFPEYERSNYWGSGDWEPGLHLVTTDDGE